MIIPGSQCSRSLLLCFRSRDCSVLGAPSGEEFLFCCVCASLDKLLAAVGSLCSDFKDLVVLILLCEVFYLQQFTSFFCAC